MARTTNKLKNENAREIRFSGFKSIYYGLLIFGLIFVLNWGVSAYSSGDGATDSRSVDFTCIWYDRPTQCGNGVCETNCDEDKPSNPNRFCPVDCAPASTCIDITNDLRMGMSRTLCSGTYNINDTGENGVIIINADNIVLDCNGSVLFGNNGGVGIINLGHDNVTIKNCNIQNYGMGIYVKESFNHTIENNILNNNYYASGTLEGRGYGIYLREVSDSTVDHNVMNLNGDTIGCGLLLEVGSTNNDIIYNTMNFNKMYGVCLLESTENYIAHNAVDLNTWGIYSQNSTAKINSNSVCGNTNSDFSSLDWLSSSGNKNACETGNWNDDEINGCWYTCSGVPRICDPDHDGIYIHDYNNLMTAYKCFLGIINCNNNYQNWNLIKSEYECFVNAQ